MAHDRQEFLRELEDRLSRMSSWLGGRRAGGQAPGRLRARLESIRRDLSRAPHAGAQEFRDAIASAHAAVDDMEHDYEAPPAHAEFRRDELQALKHHLQLTARLLPHVSNLDDPGWTEAREELDRSWDEMRRAFEEGDAASP